MTVNPCAAYPAGQVLPGRDFAEFRSLHLTSHWWADWPGTVNPKMVAIANLYPYPNVHNTSNGGRLDEFVYGPGQGNVETASEDFGQIRVDAELLVERHRLCPLHRRQRSLAETRQLSSVQGSRYQRVEFSDLGRKPHLQFGSAQFGAVSFARTHLSILTLPSSSANASLIEAPDQTSLITIPTTHRAIAPAETA